MITNNIRFVELSPKVFLEVMIRSQGFHSIVGAENIIYVKPAGKLHPVTHLLSFLQLHRNLSSSLKERLKRSRRSFTSPVSVAKRLCVDDDDEDGRQVTTDYRDEINSLSPVIPSVDINRNVAKSGSETNSGRFPKAKHPPVNAVAHELDRLRKEVKDKMETLRRLKMVKMYRSKVRQEEQNQCYCIEPD